MIKDNFYLEPVGDGCLLLVIQPLDTYRPMRALREMRKEVETRKSYETVEIRLFDILGELWLYEKVRVTDILESNAHFVLIMSKLFDAEEIIRAKGLLS